MLCPTSRQRVLDPVERDSATWKQLSFKSHMCIDLGVPRLSQLISLWLSGQSFWSRIILDNYLWCIEVDICDGQLVAWDCLTFVIIKAFYVWVLVIGGDLWTTVRGFCNSVAQRLYFRLGLCAVHKQFRDF
jgi:hypothetical protein